MPRWSSEYNFRNGKRGIWIVLCYKSLIGVINNTSKKNKRKDY